MDGVERATKLMALCRITGKRLQTARASILGAELGRSIVYAAGHECRPRSSATTRLHSSAHKIMLMRLVKLGILKEMTGRKAQSDFYRAGILQLTGASDLEE